MFKNAPLLETALKTPSSANAGKFGKEIYSPLKMPTTSVAALINWFSESYTTPRATFLFKLPCGNDTVRLILLFEIIPSDLHLY